MSPPVETIVAPAAASPIDCETAVQRLWDYLDGCLGASAHDEVEAHLTACAACPPHFTFARRMQRALAATAPQSSDVGIVRLQERVRSALRRMSSDDRERCDADVS